jgi:malonate transporter and related proteins
MLKKAHWVGNAHSARTLSVSPSVSSQAAAFLAWSTPMSAVGQSLLLSAPLFGVVLLGYLLAGWARWPARFTAWVSRLVLNVVLPAMLFHLLSDFGTLPAVDPKLLLAFFGGCLIVFAIGRGIGARLFKLDPASQSVFAMGGVFSNNVLLGLPLARITLGAAAVPAVALVVVFNALTLWTVLSVSIEWARTGSLTVRGFGRTALGILATPLIAGILAGTLFGLSGARLPAFVDQVLRGVGSLAGPGALLVLGMGLAQHGVRGRWRESLVICALKLLLLPTIVWCLAALLQLPMLETSAIVLLASMAVGANVYLMATQYQTLQAPMAASLVLSTALSAFTTPILLWIIGAV